MALSFPMPFVFHKNRLLWIKGILDIWHLSSDDVRRLKKRPAVNWYSSMLQFATCVGFLVVFLFSMLQAEAELEVEKQKKLAEKKDAKEQKLKDQEDKKKQKAADKAATEEAKKQKARKKKTYRERKEGSGKSSSQGSCNKQDQTRFCRRQEDGRSG